MHDAVHSTHDAVANVLKFAAFLCAFSNRLSATQIVSPEKQGGGKRAWLPNRSSMLATDALFARDR